MSAKRETITNKFERLASGELGETVVLLISTHGLIIKKEDEDDVDTFRVPHGITIKRAAVSVPGECNIVGEQDVIGYESLINSQMNKLLNKNENTQDFAINTVLGAIRREDIRDLSNKYFMISDNKRRKERGDESYDESDDEHLQNRLGYVRHFDKAHRFKTFEEGEHILNKKYVRTNLQATRSDWVIKVMSIRTHGDKPDLLEYLRTQTRFGDSSIRLEDIVDFFAQKGVKNIIIFDLSCANIATPDHEEYDQRTVRQQRRDIKMKGYGGKSRRYKKKVIKRVKKTRKNRKHYKK